MAGSFDKLMGAHNGARMTYPYTLFGKVAHFPWKYHWKNARAFRYITYSLVLLFPLIYKIEKAVTCPENIEMWKNIRQNRLHDKFAPPKEP